MTKIYQHDSKMVVTLLLMLVGVPLLLGLSTSHFSIAQVAGIGFFLVSLFYLLLMPGCWDVYLYPDKLVFRNEFNFLWSNEWEFALKEVIGIEVKKMAKEGPCIYVITNHSRERFFTLGYQSTLEFTNDIRQVGIKVDSQL